tara:strand:- start:313 stop:1140 length:828 start_codon:yes stop_codon:yes gene_type:complete
MEQKKFIKMQGLGNDFVIFFWDDSLPPKKLIQNLSDRKIGIGCDLSLFIKNPESDLVDYVVNFFNSDGSEAEICGNALRCVGKLNFNKTKKKNCLIETKAGLIDVEYINEDKISVNIGVAKFDWKEIPLSKNIDTLNLDLNYDYLKNGLALNIGNPHLIFFADTLDMKMLKKDSEKIKKSKLFSEGVNISVVKVNSKDAISVLTYERGVGITQACGTGACASVVASNKLNLVEKKVTVTMSGGLLEVEICNDHNILMVGKADIVFEGEIDLSRLM